MNGTYALPAWRDAKRPLWLLSLLVPALVGSGPWLYLAGGSPTLLWLPLLIAYLGLPLLDWLLGEDASNAPEALLQELDGDLYYRWITWALVPMLWLWMVYASAFSMRPDLPWHGWLALAWASGLIGGFCINVGHELGHKRGRFERWLARLALAPTGYGHFTVEHNRGHHRDVATPDDPASARFGESIWRFALREWPGAWRRAFRLERERLKAQGRPWWHPANELVGTGLISLGFYLGLCLWLGPGVLPFLLLASAIANFQLTSANYIEHYGIARKRLPDGRHEPVAPRHSWNSNHLVSNWALFHLQRHSDHHAHATRRYQCLRHFPEAPQLPSGYFGMFLLAYVPALWFRVMNPRLADMVGADPERINFDPAREPRLRQWVAARAAAGSDG